MKSARRRLLGSNKAAPSKPHGRGCAIIQAKSGDIGSF
jgi:hypothetical protein